MHKSDELAETATVMFSATQIFGSSEEPIAGVVRLGKKTVRNASIGCLGKDLTRTMKPPSKTDYAGRSLALPRNL